MGLHPRKRLIGAAVLERGALGVVAGRSERVLCFSQRLRRAIPARLRGVQLALRAFGDAPRVRLSLAGGSELISTFGLQPLSSPALGALTLGALCLAAPTVIRRALTAPVRRPGGAAIGGLGAGSGPRWVAAR